MKRIAWLFMVVLGSVILMNAQNSTKSMELSGTVCQSTCVTQVDNLATCDKLCTDKSGNAVFVDDRGGVKRIANQDMCQSHMGKHVKMRATPTGTPSENQREQTLHIEELSDDVGGG